MVWFLSVVYTTCRYAHLQELSEKRAQKLQDSLAFQAFLRDIDEVSLVYIIELLQCIDYGLIQRRDNCTYAKLSHYLLS